MKTASHSFSRAGPSHENQDSVTDVFKAMNMFAFAIADGIGGKPGGEFASRLATKTFQSLFLENPNRPVNETFEAIRRTFVTESETRPDLAQMGTTLTVCVLHGNGNAFVGHVGDTRIYHLRGQGIVDRIKDQTKLQHLIDQGILSKERAKRYDRRNILLSALGPNSEYDLYEETFSIQPGDRIILLTDGVYRLIPRREIRDFSLRHDTLSGLSSALQATVVYRGPIDDYSALCVEIIS